MAIVAVELLRRDGAAEWQSAALVPMFARFHVLAPCVGAFANAQLKRQVMFFSNAIKDRFRTPSFHCEWRF